MPAGHVCGIKAPSMSDIADIGLGAHMPAAYEQVPQADVERIFRLWQRAANKPTARLDQKREKLIRKAIVHYGVADTARAVVGWKCSPFYRGQNDRHKVYNDLGLLLRDAAHIERFIELANHPEAGPPKRSPLLQREERGPGGVAPPLKQRRDSGRVDRGLRQPTSQAGLEQILGAVQQVSEPLTCAQIATLVGVPAGSITSKVSSLVRSGQLLRQRQGSRWVYTTP